MTQQKETMPTELDLLRSLTKRAQEPVEATLHGAELPHWLSGTLYRNGPGRYEYTDKAHKHLFDGHSCVHKFKIESGKVTYSNKFLETKSYTQAAHENRLFPVFGTADLCSTIFGRLKTFFELPDTFDNVNVSILPFGEFKNGKILFRSRKS
jgi:beta,beta-carotene 9',10'-dioxygenase